MSALALVLAFLLIGQPRAHADTTTTYSGTTANGAWTLSVPAQFNGTLLLYSHGYRFTPGAAQSAPRADVATQLLAQGYALAGSSYAGGGAGWAVLQGVAADVELIGIVKAKLGSTAVKRVYAWGDSLGGLVTQTLAEKRPDLVSGVAPMCGVLAGTNLNLDLALDAAVAVKTSFYPQLKLTGYSSLAEANAQYDAAQKAIMAKLTNPSTQAGAVGRVIGLALLLGAPLKTANANGSLGPSEAAKAATESLLTALKYGTAGRFDIERRVGGNPSSNVGVDYRHRVTPAALAQFTALGFSSGLLSSYAQTLQTYGARVPANSVARTRADALGNPSGALADKTITMHTEYDPLVIVQNEAVFKARAVARTASGLLQQLYIKPPEYRDAAPYGAGHCNFSTVQYLGVVKALDTWVSTNTKPTNSQLATWFAGDGGLDVGYAPAAWPAR